MKELDYNISDKTVRLDLQIIKETIEEIEIEKANISSGNGAPSGGSDNDLYVDTAAGRLYVNVGGIWKYIVLT